MDDQDKYSRYANIPIPSYEEAISRPTSSQQNHRGPHEVSDDAERQGLLGRNPPAPPPNNTTAHLYQPPTVESARSSVDSDLNLPEVRLHAAGSDADDAELSRRHIEELDYLDPSAPDPSHPNSLYHRARSRSKFAQRLSNLGATLSSLRLPSFRSLYSPVHPSETPETAAAAATEAAQPPPPPASRLAWLSQATARLPRIPPQYLISAPNAARLFGLLTLALLVYFLLIADVLPGGGGAGGGGGRSPFAPQFDPEAVRAFVQDRADASRIGEFLRHITSYDHVAGTEGDRYLAQWMREQWRERGGFDDTAVLPYYVYLNYPKPGGRGVEIVRPEDKKWSAVLEEEVIDPDRPQTGAWHGYSWSGEVEGHLVYANEGRREDFEWLLSVGVGVKGSIALVRADGTPGGAAGKVRVAEDVGCAGVLIYSDPVDDGSVRGAVWPEGPWRPTDSLQRDSVAISGSVLGDPLTPGWASSKDAAIVDPSAASALPHIPSLPLAWRDAKALLTALHGFGVEVPGDWVGGDEGFTREWFTGASPADNGDVPIVRVRNVNDENSKQQIWNVHGLIRGVESPDKKVIIGNHHDSWCFGSVNPGSGTAVMMEVVEILGQLRSHGWRPLRTIEFVSWDAQEYNMVGSTEYVEDNVGYLRDHGLAYLNVDTGTYGAESTFRAAGSPMWQRPLLHVLDRVDNPGGNGTLRQVWDQYNFQLQALRAESDYVAFQDIAGTSSLDFGFDGASQSYPRHSCYETFDWMVNFGDPGFQHSHTLAQVWALLILELSDRPIVPYDVHAYAEKIQGPYLDSLQRYAEAQFERFKPSNGARDLHDTGFDLGPLRQAGADLAARAEEFHKFENDWTSNVMTNSGFENTQWMINRLNYNEALSRFDSSLLDLPAETDKMEFHGVPGSPQFKHVIFGPQSGLGQEIEVFPFVREALTRGDWAEAQKMVQKTADIIQRATQTLTYE